MRNTASWGGAPRRIRRRWKREAPSGRPEGESDGGSERVIGALYPPGPTGPLPADPDQAALTGVGAGSGGGTGPRDIPSKEPPCGGAIAGGCPCAWPDP